ncbi:MAG: prepilin-type N-terminal cleavage/methylation domain-containing protein, partial [Candidatus Acidiferrum sp.]
MKRDNHIRDQRGFSLIEMMIATVIFVLLCGAAFALLSVAQQRYQTESQVLNSFQEARFGLD